MKQHNQKVWVGAEDLNNEPAYIERSKQEFFELPIVDAMGKDAEVIENATKGSSRRDFLKYMGFGLTAATIAASCEIPVRKAVPYVVKPDTIVPGVATYYASTFVRGGDSCSVVIKTREGRPIKIEGNTMSSMTKGGTSARVQASVLDLYNSDRIRSAGMMEGGQFSKLSWADLDKKIKGELKPDAQIRIVANTLISPTLNVVLDNFRALYPNTSVVMYDAVSTSGLLDANEASFGKRVVPNYRFDEAEVVVSFNADFLGTWISPVEYAAKFIKNRKVDVNSPKMSRLYCLESGMSLTGSNADNRVFVKPSEQGQAIVALYNAVAKAKGQPTSVGTAKLSYEKSNGAIEAIAKELVEKAGKSIVIAGSNDINEQIVVNKINDLLGNYGSTIEFENYSNQRKGSDAAIQGLIKEMGQGRVDAVIVFDANPAFDLPNADKFSKAFEKVKTRISCGGLMDETAKLCNYIAPSNHFLESWGDVEAKNGQYSLVQPTIAPLHATRQFEESLLVWANNETPYYDFLKSNWEKSIFPKAGSLDFQVFWDNCLHDGVFEVANAPATTPAFAADADTAASKVEKSTSKGLEINFYEPMGIGAGQYATNPWLMEMPDPVNRCSWDNVLMIPIKWDGDNNYTNYEEFKGLKDGDQVDVKMGDQTFRTTVMRQFGQMPGTVSIALGYGRTDGGKTGTGVGKNVYPLMSPYKSGNTKYFATGVEVSGKKGHDSEFACVQMHHTMGVTGEFEGKTINVDERILGYKGFQGSLTKRSVIHQTNLPELNEAVAELVEQRKEFQELNSKTLYPSYDYQYEQGHHWGMTVDLNSCIGCGACQVACVSENNVPVVGKREVSRHHEMTWIRIDRYYYGDVENPNVVYQPMMCQHCDNAPCENVCPVAATNHSSEGLNQMTYNRCIGTRYCANNCPYKVRRFNWLDYTTADIFPWNAPTFNGTEEPYYADDLIRMVLNPDVTVRSRGVIEKCSFCVQRIQEAKLTAKVEKRALRDGDLRTACQSACPTGAITFGDMNNPESAVNKVLADSRTYKVLEEVNTKSSVGYQMKVINKNEKIG